MRIKVHIFLFTTMITLINFWKLWFQKSRTTKSRSSLFMYHLIYSVILFSVFSMLLRIFSWLRVRFAPSTQMLARSATSCDSAPVNPDHAEIEIIQFCTVSKSQHKHTIWNVQYLTVRDNLDFRIILNWRRNLLRILNIVIISGLQYSKHYTTLKCTMLAFLCITL